MPSIQPITVQVPLYVLGESEAGMPYEAQIAGKAEAAAGGEGMAGGVARAIYCKSFS